MKLLNDFFTSRRIQRLKNSSSLPAEVLGQLELELVAMGPGAIHPLMDALSHSAARPVALRALERLLSAQTVGRYFEALASPNPAIVSGALKVLTQSQNYPASSLLELMTRRGIHKSTLEALLLAHAARLPVEPLLEAMDASPRDLQTMLLRLMEATAAPAHAPDISRLLRSRDSWVRLGAIRILSRFPAELAAAPVAELLTDEHKEVRLEAVLALHAQGSATEVPNLIPLLRDPDFKVQSAAIDALSALADARAVPLLLTVLTDELDAARRAAVEVLNAVATTEAVQDLVRALRDHDWWVRVRAADALGTLGGEKVVQAVIGLLSDEDDFIRRHAVEVLNSVPNPCAVDALLEALQDSDWWVRERAIDALGKTRDARVVEPLADLLEQGGNIETLAIRALGTVQLPEALEPLIRGSRSEREEARAEAIAALRAFPRAGLTTDQKTRLEEAVGRTPGSAGHDAGYPLRAKGGPSPHPSASPLMGGARRLDETPREAPMPARKNPAPVEPAVQPAAVIPGEPSIRHLNFSDLAPDTRLLGRYRILRCIGRGGFGTVYLAEDEVVCEELILKVLNPQLSMDESAQRRFVQELKLTRKITHRHVIRIHDFLDLGGAHAVSMEYFPGEDLGHLLARESPLNPARCLRILAQVCAGLGAAHEVGVIHRDVKPANILVGTDDDTRVVDFGLASAGQQIGSRLTRSGLLIGTPEYMAPEQITSGVVGVQADIYSVGILMYEMLSGGVRPFTGESPVKVLFLHLEGDAKPLGELAPELPEGLLQLVSCAMARNPEDRPVSASELESRLLEELATLERAA